MQVEQEATAELEEDTEHGMLNRVAFFFAHYDLLIEQDAVYNPTIDYRNLANHLRRQRDFSGSIELGAPPVALTSQIL